MRKATILLMIAGLFSLSLVGCGDTKTTSTPEENKTWTNPSKERPAEAGFGAPPPRTQGN
ncbi:MAG: hypothetical protein MUC92_04745 [Fimbriimonadaceae bacterium]|jgi:hypothetical protein|nr:hypothetical protein [Fimbriimonadaceae bacterium]